MGMSIGVCSWSLQVGSVPELVRLLDRVGASVAQVALGDPNHASWEEGATGVLDALKQSDISISATMIGYPGEDYTTPATIQATGGFGDPSTRAECLEIFRDAVARTAKLGVSSLVSHAGFIPAPGDPARSSFLDCIGSAAQIAAEQGVAFHMETGQETAQLLKTTLDELQSPSLRVNFDPANMILYDMGNPIEAIDTLADAIASVHVKDARPPKEKGAWGEEVPLGEGDVGIPEFVAALERIGFDGPLIVEREVGSQEERVRDIRAGIELLRSIAG